MQGCFKVSVKLEKYTDTGNLMIHICEICTAKIFH